MSLDLADLALRTATATVPVLGSTLTVQYRPSTITLAMYHRAAASDDPDVAANLVVEIVTGWDLKANGAPVPLTLEAIQAVPLFVVKKVLLACAQGDAESGEATGAA